MRYFALAIDLGWVALSAILAVLMRDNFVPYEPHLEAVTAYAAIAVATSTLAFVIAGLHKRLWQYTSLPDVLRIMAAVTVALLLALFISFVASRLEDVARSVPVIQWFLLVGAMVGTRVAIRIWHERARRNRLATVDASVQHVLIVGLSHLTELYLQSVAEYASKTIEIVGILSEQRELRGRLLGFHKVLGTPEELPQVMAQLEVHGIALERIVVTQPFEQLSRRAGEALLAVERGSGVRVDWMVELLGLAEEPEREHGYALGSSLPESQAMQASLAARDVAQLSLGKYGYVKRASDILGAISLSVLLAPLILVIGLLVALDVGVPLVFWQKRPGRFGRPFKLFKFCTMHPAHDAQGNRIPDEERSSIVGRLLRRIRLDELPQLYNILIGEMSFVGPRPLLPVNQPLETSARHLVRPGLTGLAQVYGRRDISPEDKNVFDIWYVQNASLWLDIKILLRTPIVMIRGERDDHYTMCAARAGLERLHTQSTARPDSYSLLSKSVVGDGQVEIAHPFM
jgi:lipopolysaccharide/colanic/teichoic acid biosynthesis glycosyltransferase